MNQIFMGKSLLIMLKQQTYCFSQSIAGTVNLDTCQYDIAIAGYLSKALKNGINIFNTAEISGQASSIVAHNNNTSVNRVMDQSAIEELEIEVYNGSDYCIRVIGRVQTKP